jgi:hypothetical protein
LTDADEFEDSEFSEFKLQATPFLEQFMHPKAFILHFILRLKFY